MPDDLQLRALLDQVDAIESEIRRLRIRSERFLTSTLQYVAGFGIAGFLLFEGSLEVAAIGLGLVLPLTMEFFRRRRTKRLEIRRDQLIESGSTEEQAPLAG